MRREQELRIRAEQEQARLLTTNHELTLLLDRHRHETEETVRDANARVLELESKLAALQEVHETGELALGKYRMRAEQVMRELEASQADQDRSRRRAEEALARTVAAAHAKLTSKQDALAAAERTRAEESSARLRLQSQLETFVAQRTAALDQLDAQLAAAKVRELDLSAKLSEANQRVEELTRRQALSDANALSLQALLASVGGGGEGERAKEREIEREEWERGKRAAAQREGELCARLAEQNHIIRLLRQTLASSSPSPGAISIPSSVSPIPSTDNNKLYDLQNKNEYLQSALEERDGKLKRVLLDLDQANRRADALHEQISTLQHVEGSPAPVRSTTPDGKRILEDQLTEERKKHEEEIIAKNREISALQDQITKMSREIDTKTREAEMAHGAGQQQALQVMQAEIDESHINEIKLLEQVEQYEFTVMQLRGRVAELERFIVEDSGGSFGAS